MKRCLIILLYGILISKSMAQFNTGDLKLMKGNNTSLPFVFYLSGDGGMNTFSNTLCQAMVAEGYTVAALNSRGYFWNKKNIETLSEDVSKYIHQQLGNKINAGVIFLGYSFGADGVPFLVNKLPANIKKQVWQAILVEPSTSTDLEIHLSDMLSRSQVQRSMDVIAEINKINSTKVCIVLGKEGNDFPLAKVTLAKYTKLLLPGDHRFGGDGSRLAKEIMSLFKL